MLYYDYYKGPIVNIKDYLEFFNLSIHKINILINQKKITINDITANHDTMIYPNDEIVIDYQMIENLDNFSKVNYDNIGDLTVLYEDAYLLIVNKPSNMVIYDLNNQDINTLDNLVKKYYLSNCMNYHVRHVHRLDKDTTGCVIYAKDPLTHSALIKQIETNQLIREYIGICEGTFNDKIGIIDEKIGRNRHDSRKMIVSKNGKYAKTKYEVIKEYNNYSVVKFILETGRTHQIRVHTSFFKHPLLGDLLYGTNNNSGSRCLLHSSRVIFIHPVTKKSMCVEAAIPLDMSRFLK